MRRAVVQILLRLRKGTTGSDGSGIFLWNVPCGQDPSSGPPPGPSALPASLQFRSFSTLQGVVCVARLGMVFQDSTMDRCCRTTPRAPSTGRSTYACRPRHRSAGWCTPGTARRPAGQLRPRLRCLCPAVRLGRIRICPRHRRRGRLRGGRVPPGRPVGVECRRHRPRPQGNNSRPVRRGLRRPAGRRFRASPGGRRGEWTAAVRPRWRNRRSTERRIRGEGADRPMRQPHARRRVEGGTHTTSGGGSPCGTEW